MEFKTGDKVRYIKETHWGEIDNLILNRIYTVRSVSSFDIETEEGRLHLWVKKSAFKKPKGDFNSGIIMKEEYA